MPKPFFLSRPSGLFVRFYVPADVRMHIGSRYLVRSLGQRTSDHARLAGACLAVALSDAFQGLRQGETGMDIKKLLESAQKAADSGDLRTWTADRVQIGRINFGRVSTTGRDDTLDFIETLKAAAKQTKGEVTPVELVHAVAPAKAIGPLLSTDIANHLGDLE